jgi:hypothetical protein
VSETLDDLYLINYFDTCTSKELEESFLIAVSSHGFKVAEYLYEKIKAERYDFHIDYHYADPENAFCHTWHIKGPHLYKLLCDTAVKTGNDRNIDVISLEYLIGKGLNLSSVIDDMIVDAAKKNNGDMMQYLLNNGGSVELARKNCSQDNYNVIDVIKKRDVIEFNNKLENTLTSSKEVKSRIKL